MFYLAKLVSRFTYREVDFDQLEKAFHECAIGDTKVGFLRTDLVDGDLYRQLYDSLRSPTFEVEFPPRRDLLAE